MSDSQPPDIDSGRLEPEDAILLFRERKGLVRVFGGTSVDDG